MESVSMEFKIIRNDESETVDFFVSELDECKIELTNSNTDDIERLYNLIFNYIIESKKLIKFNLIDDKKDLFYEVASDIVLQLNNEIQNSESNFESIIKLGETLGETN